VRISPGAGLRPTPPPLLRTQPPLPPRVRHPGGLGTGSRLFASRAAAWVAVAVDACVVERWRERGLRANVPRRRPAAGASSFTSHTTPAPSAYQASRRPWQNSRLWLLRPQAEPLCGWQAFGQSKGGGDRRRRATGDICPNACHPRSGPNARNESDRSSTKSPGRCQGFSFGAARAPYFFFGMYRSVIVPS
jgi:hypothetical protein